MKHPIEAELDKAPARAAQVHEDTLAQARIQAHKAADYMEDGPHLYTAVLEAEILGLAIRYETRLAVLASRVPESESPSIYRFNAVV